MTADLPQVQLRERYRFDHPWIFSRLLIKPTIRIPPGSVVNVVGPDGSFVGRGFYNGHSRIGIRLMTTDPQEAVDGEFLAKRLAEAVSWRQSLGLVTDHSGVRLCNAEGDGLSGLVIDKFANVIAVQFFAAGMFRLRDALKATLANMFPGTSLYWFAEERIQKQESFDCWEVPAPEPTIIEENGVKFHVRVGSKHKTGFFADQRENRQMLGALSRGKSVVDLCCHTGGFAIFAAKGGARRVIGVDLDEEDALQTARANAELNGVTAVFVGADVYAWLRDAVARQEQHDVVILDPAKQTRSADGTGAALAQYQAMNRMALQVVAPGGLLLSCSCSGLISEEDFLGSIRRAASDAKRRLQVFRVSGAAPDHPFAVNVPEGRYLKAVWCRVL